MGCRRSAWLFRLPSRYVGRERNGKTCKAYEQHGRQLQYACSNCHPGYAFNSTDDAVHANRTINVTLGSGAYSGGTTPGDQTPGGGYGSCSNTYCHSNANPVNGSSSTFQQIDWSTGTTSCTSCHRGPESFANMGVPGTGGTNPPDRLSVAHKKHAATDIYAFTCDECHAETIANDSTGTLHASTGYANHADGIKSWKFSTTLRNTAVSQANGSYTGSGGTCANTYCHSKGTVLSGGTYSQAANLPVTTPAWGTATLACNGCHGDAVDSDGMPSYANGTPKTNSHNKHVRTYSYGCVDCHAGTVNSSQQITTPANHVNAVYNVTGAPITSYTYSTTGGTCTASCHGSSTPKWGQASPGCTFCHATLSGKHSSHVVFTNASVYGNTSPNVSGSAASYDFGCGNCHPIAAASHMNGSVDMSLNRLDGGTLKSLNSAATSTIGTGLATQCNGVYCHSDGKATPTYVLTPRWDTAFTALNSCGNCHGNSPTGSNHQAHVVGIHYDTIYTGTTGLATAGVAAANSHGNSAYSTTINCNLCHSGTVAKSRNKYGAVCVTCHTEVADATNSLVTADITKTMHVNGQPDVALQAVYVRSRAQLRDDITTVAELNTNWTRTAGNYKAGATPFDLAKNALNTATMWNGVSKTCSNIACHNGKAITWSATISCDSCHTQVTK